MEGAAYTHGQYVMVYPDWSGYAEYLSHDYDWDTPEEGMIEEVMDHGKLVIRFNNSETFVTVDTSRVSHPYV